MWCDAVFMLCMVFVRTHFSGLRSQMNSGTLALITMSSPSYYPNAFAHAHMFADSHFSHFAHNTFVHSTHDAAENGWKLAITNWRSVREKCEPPKPMWFKVYHSCLRSRSFALLPFQLIEKSTKLMARKMCVCTRWFSFFSVVFLPLAHLTES